MAGGDAAGKHGQATNQGDAPAGADVAKVDVESTPAGHGAAAKEASGNGKKASGNGKKASGDDKKASGDDKKASGDDKKASGDDKKASGKAATGKATKGTATKTEGAATPESDAFPIVGVGASAGGLEAYTQLLSELAPDTGMAFVLVQHLEPHHESRLPQLLSKATSMPVLEAKNDMAVEPDHVYVIPPGASMEVRGGLLKLVPRVDRAGQHLAINHFFESLAEDREDQAIGIVLSGTGSDGTLGLKAIKAAGGITLAQDEDSARYSSMPVSAQQAGVVDFTMSPADIAQELETMAGHPFIKRTAVPTVDDLLDQDVPSLEKIVILLRAATKVDFSQYKQSTFKRRILRRMALHDLTSLQSYVEYLRAHPEEVLALYKDALINVSGFFRDTRTYDALREKVLPELLSDNHDGEPIRIWVAGCASGEEVYSIAMLLLEAAGDSAGAERFQIFGSDLNEENIHLARQGNYKSSIESEVDETRLRRFFVKSDGGYRISKHIRDMCVFSVHNVFQDPPFSKVDLVSCRNVLIYLRPEAQRRALAAFHYALRPEGYLTLGPSESTGPLAAQFSSVDTSNRIYQRKPGPAHLSYSFFSSRLETIARPPEERRSKPETFDLSEHVDRLLLDRFTPAGVLIDEQGEIIEYRGQTSPWLKNPPGRPTTNLYKLAPPGLDLELRRLVSEAGHRHDTTRRRRFSLPGGTDTADLVVAPITDENQAQRSFLVLFDHHEVRAQEEVEEDEDADNRTAARLREELQRMQAQLQATLEENDTTTEELRTANEEALSINEELQSTNEELQTTAEELQSANEELTTLNEELQNRNRELSHVNNDLENLLTSVRMPIVFLGADLTIRRFTPAAEKVLNLRHTDVGRPISDLRPNIEVDGLEDRIHKVIETVQPHGVEVRDGEGHWQRLRIEPYRTMDNRIDGAVLVLVDVDELKRTADELRRASQDSETVFQTVPDPLAVVTREGVVRSCNKSFQEMAGQGAAGQGLTELLAAQQADVEAVKRIERAVSRGARLQGLALQTKDKQGARRFLHVDVAGLASPDDRGGDALVLLRDVTEEESSKARLQHYAKELERSNRDLEQFAAFASHELKGPLNNIRNYVQLGQRILSEDTERAEEHFERASENLVRLQRLIRALLHYARIQGGELDAAEVDLARVVDHVIERLGRDIDGAELSVEHDGLPTVRGDPVLLDDLFTNLIGNALNHAGAGSHVRITTERDGDGWRIYLDDDGQGIPPKERTSAMKMFQRGGGSAGAGIGLAVCQRIVERHGGAIRLDASPAGGTRVEIRIPS